MSKQRVHVSFGEFVNVMADYRCECILQKKPYNAAGLAERLGQQTQSVVNKVAKLRKDGLIPAEFANFDSVEKESKRLSKAEKEAILQAALQSMYRAIEAAANDGDESESEVDIETVASEV